LVRVVLELVGERASELGLKDRILDLDQTAELLRQSDLFDVRAVFVEPGCSFFEPVAGARVQLGPLQGSYEGDAWPVEFVRTAEVEV
jgi:hypothetical protein